MKRSSDRILTTHVGSLVRPRAIIEAMFRASRALPYESDEYRSHLRDAVDDVVRRQANVGIDIPSDGEFGKIGWARYVTQRLTGIEYKPVQERKVYSDLVYYDRERFADFYRTYPKLERSMWLPELPTEDMADTSPHEWVCTGEIKYRGDDAIKRDIENFKSALRNVEVEEAFMPCAAPCSVQIISPSDAYKSEEDYVFAIADALRPEYRAVVDAGFVLQLDDAALPMHYNPSRGLDEYLRWASIRIDAANHALRGIPADRVRYHICWGSQNAPHTWDIPLKDLVGLLLKLNIGALSIEAANPRHEHEWQVWEHVRLPNDKLLIPGLISHSTNVVEHPELIAWRIGNFARLVGRENLIAGTDCGFSQNWDQIRVHPEIQWAKLEALVEGAEMASRQLWGSSAV